jgi:hypothetical protein
LRIVYLRLAPAGFVVLSRDLSPLFVRSRECAKIYTACHRCRFPALPSSSSVALQDSSSALFVSEKLCTFALSAVAIFFLQPVRVIVAHWIIIEANLHV